MHHEIDLSGESPALVGEPLDLLPKGVRNFAQQSLDDLSTALNPPGEWGGRAFWPIVDAPAPTQAWQELAIEPTYEIDAEARQVRAVRAAVDRDLAAVKAIKCAAIDAERDARYAGGVAFTFPGDVAGTVQTRPGTDDLVTIAGLSTRAAVALPDARFEAADHLVLGRESAGVPDDVHAAVDLAVRVPMVAGARSLNVAVTAGIVLAEALRQTGGWPPG